MADISKYLEKPESLNTDERYEACEELRVAENIPPHAISALQRAANDSDPLVADAARRALMVHSKDAVPTAEPSSSDQTSLYSQSQFAMDGTVCLKEDDGSVTIKSRQFRNVLFLIIFGLVLLTTVACLFDALIAYFFNGKTYLSGRSFHSTGDLLVFLLVGLSFGMFTVVPMRILVRRMKAPLVRFNTESKMLEIGFGSQSRLIPFSRIADSIAFTTEAIVIEGYEQFGLAIVLDDGEVLELGSISGKKSNEEARKRAEKIANLIGGAIGLPVH